MVRMKSSSSFFLTCVLVLANTMDYLKKVYGIVTKRSILGAKIAPSNRAITIPPTSFVSTTNVKAFMADVRSDQLLSADIVVFRDQHWSLISQVKGIRINTKVLSWRRIHLNGFGYPGVVLQSHPPLF